jgi:hypothetical protein
VYHFIITENRGKVIKKISACFNGSFLHAQDFVSPAMVKREKERKKCLARTNSITKSFNPDFNGVSSEDNFYRFKPET